MSRVRYIGKQYLYAHSNLHEMNVVYEPHRNTVCNIELDGWFTRFSIAIIYKVPYYSIAELPAVTAGLR